MIQLMNALELRTFKDNEIIANEQDEALEVLFIDKGTYDVGYEINKKAFYRKRFGPSTCIGGFQACYLKRFSFVYKSYQNLKGLAVRKEKFVTILNQFHNIQIQIKLKFWDHFSQQIFQPLMKMKNIDILNYNFRSDFKQLLCLNDDTNLFQDVVKMNFLQIGKKMFANNDCLILKQRLEETSDKIDRMFKLGVNIFEKSEAI